MRCLDLDIAFELFENRHAVLGKIWDSPILTPGSIVVTALSVLR